MVATKWKSRTPKTVMRFAAGLRNRSLSNFAQCKVVVDGTEYPSTEHAWQARKARRQHVRHMFAVGGSLAQLADATLQRFYPKTSADKIKKKVAYWMRGKSVGIVAKLAANEKHAKKLGFTLGDFDYAMEHLPEHELERIWLGLLRAKYTQNDDMREALLATGDTYLLEFDRGATRRDSFWGGIDDGNGGITGNNFMGRMLMKVRDELCAKAAK